MKTRPPAPATLGRQPCCTPAQACDGGLTPFPAGSQAAGSCCAPAPGPCSCGDGDLSGLPQADCSADTPCCGGPPPPAASSWERPGYAVCPFVLDFLSIPADPGANPTANPVPRIATRLGWRDHLGTVLTRCGIGRNSYAVAPGLYALGRPDPDSPVLVTANSKLTFDALRRDMDGQSAWLLVLDTRGVNVWCAAGKQLFSTREVALRVLSTGLARVVRHRTLILPQLSATGVKARDLRRACGFSAEFGPVRSADLPAFLKSGNEAEPAMRRVTFTLAERLVLVPVEIYLLKKPLAWGLAAIVLLAGFGSWGFSWAALMQRGVNASLALAAGVLAGCALVPALLPWLPGRAFALKGVAAGGLAAVAVLGLWWGRAGLGEGMGLLCLLLTVASYTGMNFTGSTPYTSPSGVEKEMRRAMPFQAAGLILAIIFWLASAFAAS